MQGGETHIMTSPTHLNNYDLLSRIMDDLNDFIDKRGNKQLIPALIAVKEQRDEVMRLRALASKLTDGYDEEFGPINEWGEAKEADERIAVAMKQHFASMGLDIGVTDIKKLGASRYAMRVVASEATHHPAPTHTPACRAGEIDVECPCEPLTQYCVHGTEPEQCPSCACRAEQGMPIGKLSTDFNNPSLQLRWEIEGVAHIEVEQTMLPHRYNIAEIYVDPEYQNLGIGTALMNIVLHEADLVGIELWLVPTAMPGKQKALNDFYMRFGFEGLKGSGYMIRKSPTAEPEE